MREQNTEYILSLSYGKDSLACLGAIQHLGWPLDRIVTASERLVDGPEDEPNLYAYDGSMTVADYEAAQRARAAHAALVEVVADHYTPTPPRRPSSASQRPPAA